MELLSIQMLLVFAIFGCSAGFAAGLLGIGGGVILVPLFLWGFDLAGIDQQLLVHAAFATSLAVIIPTAISNTHGHNKRGNVQLDQVVYLAGGAIVGAVVGVWGATLLSGAVLKMAFGVMQISVAAKMISGAVNSSNTEPQDNISLLLFTGFVGGAFSSFFGIGGGVVAVPLMVLLLRFPIHLAVGNSSALIVVSSLFGTCAYIYTGWAIVPHDNGFLGFVFLPAVAMVVPFSLVGSKLGVHFSGRVEQAELMRLFAALLVVIGLRIIWSSLSNL